MKVNNKEVGQRLFELRKSKNLTQEELSKIFKVSKMSVNRWEKGERNPTTENLQKYTNYFNVSINWIKYGNCENGVLQAQIDEINRKLNLILQKLEDK